MQFITGAGLQGGNADFGKLDQIFDGYLVLSGDEGLLDGRGDRCWFRPMNTVHIDNPEGDAQAVLFNIFAPYSHGVRNIVYPNEVIAVEGLQFDPNNATLDTDSYNKLNAWGVKFCDYLKDSAALSGMPDIRLWTPALSPGHQEDDGIVGFRLLKDFLSHPLVYGIAGHFYWTPTNGWLTDADAQWWSKRVEHEHGVLTDMGIDKPWAVTEFNRKVDRSNQSDIDHYVQQVREYYQYLAGLGFVEAAFTFLATDSDSKFDDLTLSDMPGALDELVGLSNQVNGTAPSPQPAPAPSPAPVPAPAPAPDPSPAPTTSGYVFDGSFEAKRVESKGKWLALNAAALDSNGDWVQDFVETGGSRRFGILREYADQPGVVYRYWCDRRDLS